MIAYDALIKYIGTAKKASPECPLLDVHFAYYKVLKPYRQHLAKEAEELILKPNGTQHLGVFFSESATNLLAIISGPMPFCSSRSITATLFSTLCP